MARKRNPLSVIRAVTSFEQGVQFTVTDGIKGAFYVWRLDWDEVESMCRKYGEKHPIGELPRGVSRSIRLMMEADPDAGASGHSS